MNNYSPLSTITLTGILANWSNFAAWKSFIKKGFSFQVRYPSITDRHNKGL